MARIKFLLLILTLLCLSSIVWSETDPNDFAILQKFREGLDNPEVLNWPSKGNDPCGASWKDIYCDGSRITQIQTKDLQLSGTLPQDLNKLTELTNIGLQNNNLSGSLPSFAGLSKLEKAYLGSNKFDTIPSDFFNGLTSLQVISLERNPLNQSSGWALPSDLKNSPQLTNLYLSGCNLIGPMPEFLGSMGSLTVLDMSYNSLSGEIPASYSGLQLQFLKLNNQYGSKLSDPIDVVASMTQLTVLWLHGNAFTGPIPNSIGACTSLQQVLLNDNQFVGLIPNNLTSLPELKLLQLQNNKLMGPIPKVAFSNFTFLPNPFCQSTIGETCSPAVTALLNFLESVNYPLNLVTSWTGNDPCASWLGVSCSNNNKVIRINLPNLRLNGTINPSLGKLDSLVDILLGGNNLTGTIPDDITSLPSLKLLNISDNDIGPPVPKFSSSVKLLVNGNPKLDPTVPPKSPSGGSPITPPGGEGRSGGSPITPPGGEGRSGGSPITPPRGEGRSGGSPITPPRGEGPNSSDASKGSTKSKLPIIIVPIVAGVLLISLVILFLYRRWKARKGTFPAPSSIVVHPRDSCGPRNAVKVTIANNANNSVAPGDLGTGTSGGTSDTHVIESGNLVISVQILRNVTKNFSAEQELGRGGFGVVYRGELHDGTKIAVKRMNSGVLSYKAFDEFEAEIAVLSKVRHRNLVSLLGFSAEGNEKLLVYEYMPKGALSKHVFHWKELNLEPLTWRRRLNIALDVARAMEYLHSLAHQSFIHRDLKSSNILLDDDYRAKVSDFGLVKLAPDGKFSVATRLAGTFGYLAPEYAVMGKVTTKSDVFSYGVVLIELLTGMTALDEDRPEESRHLASWFYRIKSDMEKLGNVIDKSLDASDKTFEEICIVAELAGHCISREPQQRPDMGHAVNVLAPLVDKWKPVKDELEESLGIDLGQPLLQMVKGWQDADGKYSTSSCLDDSKGSIPSRPTGFADSFTSADGR